MVERMGAALFVGILFFCLSFRTAAQESSHERVGVERKLLLEITTGIGLGIDTCDRAQGSGIMLSPDLYASVVLSNFLYFSLSIPTTGYLGIGGSDAGRGALLVGDPSLACGVTFRAGDWRLGVNASYQYPAGVWQEEVVKSLGFGSGSGYSTFSLALSANRSLDPLVLGARLRVATTLPRAEADGSSIRPLTLGLGLSCTDVLNSVAAISGSVEPGFALARIKNGLGEAFGNSYRLASSLSFILNLRDYGFVIGLQKDLLATSASPTLSLDFSYRFFIKGEEK